MKSVFVEGGVNDTSQGMGRHIDNIFLKSSAYNFFDRKQSSKLCLEWLE